MRFIVINDHDEVLIFFVKRNKVISIGNNGNCSTDRSTHYTMCCTRYWERRTDPDWSCRCIDLADDWFRTCFDTARFHHSLRANVMSDDVDASLISPLRTFTHKQLPPFDRLTRFTGSHLFILYLHRNNREVTRYVVIMTSPK